MTNATDCTDLLPHIQLKIRGHVFEAAGGEPVPWVIYAEALMEPEHAARTRIMVDGKRVADVTIHSPGGDIELVQEVQEVAAALVWSAIRSVLMKTRAELAWKS